MQKHNVKAIPPGFRPVLWSEVRPGELVYIQGADRAYGPHEVVDQQRRLLKNLVNGQQHTLYDDVLLYNTGPLAIVARASKTFVGLYTDIPMEVAEIRMDEDGDLLFTMEQLRSRPLNSLPDDFRTVLDRNSPQGWKELFGKWQLVEAAAVANAKAEEKVSLFIRNQLAAVALITELLRTGRHVEVQPGVNGTYEFLVTPAELDFLTSHLEGLLEGVVEGVQQQ